MRLRVEPALAIAAAALAASCASPEGSAREGAGTTAQALGPDPEARADHRFCGWLHGAIDDPAFTDRAYDTFAAHAGDFDAVHPVWWRVDSPTTFANHPRDRQVSFAGFHDARVLDHTTPGGGRTRLIPMIGASDRPEFLQVHRMINDPALRHEHVRALVALVTENGYDGIDLDYEHLDPDHLKDDIGPGHDAGTERVAFSAFVDEAAAALHAAGKRLSVAVPVVLDVPDPVYDYDALSRAVDAVHLMTYDFHYEGGTHAGPLAPLGWVEGTLATIRAIDGGRRAGRFLLGLANYGLIGPEVSPGGYGHVDVCEPTTACLARFPGDYDATSSHMQHCDLVKKLPPYAAGRAPNKALPGGDTLFFEDLDSLDEKMAAAQQSGLGGVTYWAIGGEPEGPGGESFFTRVRARFPRQ
jgi:chitinase